MSFRKNLHWFVYSLFLLGCARQTSPTGGPKDTIPPNLQISTPTDGEINFKSRVLELTFDESIILNNPKEQIIITPDIGKEYEFGAKKNKVILKLNNDLEENTTYSINFRDAIQDITEKNPAQALKIAFSTGTYIDSLSFEGIVFDPLTTKEIKDATVALYQSDTFYIFQHKPIYFSKTDTKGKFLIGNLKPGVYSIYAFDDKNKNLLVDSKSESYGFIAETQTLKSNIAELTIPIIHLDTRPLKLTSARPSGTYFNIKATKNLKSYTIQSDQLKTLYSSYGEDAANVRVYNNLLEYDSIPIRFTALDSIDNKIDTTLYMKFTKRDIKPEPFRSTLSDFRVVGTKGSLTGEISFSKPILKINYDSILYRIDSAKVVAVQQQDITIDSIHNKVIIKKTFDKTLLSKKPDPTTSVKAPTDNKLRREEKLKNLQSKAEQIQNQLYIAPGSFISIEQDSSARAAQTVTPATLESTGVILVQVTTKEKNYIIQLLTKDHKQIRSVHNTPTASFEDLPPADYQLRLVIDQDNNGEWSPGNFFTQQEPEPIKFYRTEKKDLNINLKANWEIGPLLITY